MSVGELLAHARATRGLSLQDLSDATKLRVSALDAMEHDDFRHCGGAAYVRGQLRSLAPLLGLDPDDLVAAYYQDRRRTPAA